MLVQCVNTITKQLRRFKYAIQGITYALKTDASYRSQFIIGGLAIIIFSYFSWPLDKSEMVFLGLAWVLILITELQNTSFETALNHLHPEQHQEIGNSKDMAAGSVLTAGLFLVFVMLVITFA